MRYSGLMRPERPAACLTSNHHKRPTKQLVFKIGETIHSGPTLATPAVYKDEDLTTTTPTTTTTTTSRTNKCVFPANLHKSTHTSSLDSDHLAQIPSTVPSSPQSSDSYYLGTQGSLPAPRVPDAIVPTPGTARAPKKVTPTSGLGDGECVSKVIVPQDSCGETCMVGDVVEDQNKSGNVASDEVPVRVKDVHLLIKKEPDETPLDPPSLYMNATHNEAFTSIEPEITRVKAEEPHHRKPEIYEAKYPELNKGRLLIRVQRATLNVTPSANISPSLPKENKEMVRLIQEPDTKLDSFCHTRSSRASKRIGSADFGVIEIKPEPVVSRLRRCTRTRKCSCRSDKSESETSDSRSVADESLYFDMVDKTAKLGKPKNGEPLVEDAATHVNAKFNGDVSGDLPNGAHKLKGRRVSRANSDESDSNSGSKSNGNLDHNGDKVDFSVLLEISPADRKKFESKKAKIRRKTADWLLISETERYYNEKEEIMRNKNKLDSGSESDDSDACTENQDSRSECSNESESTAGSSRQNKGKGKTVARVEEETKPAVKRQKEEPCPQKKRSRPIGSRTRKTLYDLTMLNDDDDDDDENFFGFPVSTTIPQSTRTSCGVGGLASQTRSKTKEGCKQHYDITSNTTKVGRKRLSDAERFLRDNREYYHFQETPERLRRSTSSSAEKEKVAGRLEGSCEGKEAEKKEKEKEESRLREPPPPPLPPPPVPPACKKRPAAVVDGRRVTRSAGVILAEPDFVDKPRAKSAEKDKRKTCEDAKEVKRKSSEDDKSKKGCDESKGKCVEESEGRISSEEESRSVCDEGKESDIRKSVSESENRTSGDTAECTEPTARTKEPEESSSATVIVSDGNESAESKVKPEPLRDEANGTKSEFDDLYFSFEGIPDQESWYQTYQRFIDGAANNEFTYHEEPLKFVLPYEMPKEYVRDFLCYKKGLLAKKKNDFADLVRKSPRCHASTLALFSDILPSKRAKNAKVLRSAPPKVEDQSSSDGTSTPGAESTKVTPPETFETTEELAILALHIDHIMKSEGYSEEVRLCSPHIDELKDTDAVLEYKKTPPKKRGKKRRLLASKTEKSLEHAAKEFKLFDSSLAQEVDPNFLAGLCDDMKDFLIPENILAREASEVVEDSCFCVCTDRASCDELSSADDNTEANSECVSLCDSETIDCSVVSEPKRGRSAKKRRKNLTGWPKTQKRKKPTP